jgi:dipeptidase E
MRLYLSSDRLGDSFGELLAMADERARVAVISNAVDFIADADRQAYARNVFDPIGHFRAHGLEAMDLDLRAFFGQAEALAEELQSFQVVWAVGGNVFLLRRAMRQSGFDLVAPDLVRDGRLVYAGWSAGACVAGPTLRGLELMDDPAVVVTGYDPEPIWEGLGLIDVAIVPHFRSDHDEAEAADKAAAWMTAHGVAHRTLRDGDVLIQNGDTLELHAT